MNFVKLIYHFFLRFISILSILIVFCGCGKPIFNAVCDASSQDFTKTVILKSLVGDDSGICSDGKISNKVSSLGNTSNSCVFTNGIWKGCKLNLNNQVSVFAGSYGNSGTVDGIGTNARFSSLKGITSDGQILYVTDSTSIRKININTKEVTTINSTFFSDPSRITTNGDYIFVTDAITCQIGQLQISTGNVSILAGSDCNSSTDGTGTGAAFNGPYGITNDGNYLYVVDENTSYIRKIEISSGIVTTILGASSPLVSPSEITTDGNNLYVVDNDNCLIRKIVISTGDLSTIAGTFQSCNTIDGMGTNASFLYPVGIVTDGVNLFVTETYGSIRKIVIQTGEVTTISQGWFSSPFSVALDGRSLYILDNGNYIAGKIE